MTTVPALCTNTCAAYLSMCQVICSLHESNRQGVIIISLRHQFGYSLTTTQGMHRQLNWLNHMNAHLTLRSHCGAWGLAYSSDPHYTQPAHTLRAEIKQSNLGKERDLLYWQTLKLKWKVPFGHQHLTADCKAAPPHYTSDTW